jgi:hypothetical protein
MLAETLEGAQKINSSIRPLRMASYGTLLCRFESKERSRQAQDESHSVQGEGKAQSEIHTRVVAKVALNAYIWNTT